MITTSTLPEKYVIKDVFPMVLANQPVTIAGKSVGRHVLELMGKGNNEYEAALKLLESLAPAEANVMLGVQVSTSTCMLGKELVLMLTLVGTPAIAEEAAPTSAPK